MRLKPIKKLHSGLEKIYAKSIPLQDMKFSKRERSYAKLAAEYSVLTNSPMDVSEYKSEKIKPRKKDNPTVKADKLPETKKPKSEKIDKGQNKKERIKKDKSKVDRANLDGNQPKLKRDKIEKVKTDRAARAERNNIPGRSLEKPTKVKRPKPNDVDSKHYAEKYKSKPYSCEIVEDILDDVTRQRRIVLSSVTIFTHTDDELRPYFRDKDLLKCSANLSQISGYKYLTMRFRISSSNARRNFGMLQENSLLRLKLIDGSFLNFLNIQTDRGRIDNYTGDTIFTGYYALGKSAEQALLKSEVDKVRVVWSTGYEDYEIYELNFFIDQINCLNNK